MARSARRALVIADLPFGSYQASPEQCFHTAVRFMKEAGAHAVKLEGGEEMVPQVDLLARSGIPVMAHIGFTPQREHTLDPDRLDDRKLHATAEAQAAGLVRRGDPFDVMSMVIAMSMAWSPVSNVYAATAEEPAELHEQRRALLRESVRRAMAAD